MKSSNKNRFTPLFMSLSMILGVVLGLFYSAHFNRNSLSIISGGNNKLGNLLEVINQCYVDEVNMDSLIENSIPLILKELDPHSSYITKENLQEAEDQLSSSFSGIGVSFTMQKDTVNVMQVIKGGPAEKVGLLPGDRIITANEDTLIGLENTKVMKFLKGEKGSLVKLGIKRRNSADLIYYDVIRGDIPVKSVDVSYMINETTGYIHVNSFSEKTYEEFIISMVELGMNGMKNVIVDLRGNHGGYMQIAIQMANEFLKRNKLIVYTEGLHSKREDYMSNGRGSFQTMPLIVLVDDASASASEIFAGAMQDNDRATIIGRRTFGKGLVQQPLNFKDNSQLRLTIARYYTPSGRCIQKPYVSGHDEDYELELLSRYERGEYFSEDSIKNNGPAYHTTLGRLVYGGGGIRPDIFVPEDTTSITSYYREAMIQGFIREFCFAYTDDNREQLMKFESVNELEEHLRKQKLLDKFATYADKNGLQRRNLMLQQSRKLFERAIFGNIIYNLHSTEEYQEFLNEDDRTIKKALQVIESGRSFPKAGERYIFTDEDNNKDSK